LTKEDGERQTVESIGRWEKL